MQPTDAGKAGPECYLCNGIADPQLCTQQVYCGFEQQCYTERIQLGSHGVYYNMGCMDRDLCSSIDNNDIIVGKKRSAVINKLNKRYAYEVNPHSFAKRDAACKECCTDALCNLPLCALPAGSATIPPSGEIYARLLGGKTPYEGTVEVFYNGIWGAVCDDDWTPYDATVLCNMLGYMGDGARAMNGSVINSDQSKIWRDQFECRGTESSLVQCAHGAWEMRNCEQKNTAGVICSSVSPEDGAIYLLDSANHTMARMDLRTQSFTYIPMLGLYNPGPFDFDPVQRRIYFADQTYKQVNSMRFDGKDITNLKQLSQDSRPDKTKVDPINRLLFFTDDGRNAISSLNLDGSNFQDVITSGLDYPRGITLDPKAKKIYWTDWGENPKIESASYDGTDRQLLINTDIKWPNSIAIDSDNSRLYFIDGSLGKIESCDLSGGDRQVILKDNGAHFYSIDVFGAYIYYTDWARSTPMRLNKDGSGLTALGAASFQQLSEIKVYQYKNDTTGAATASPLALSPRQTFLRLVGIKDSTNGRLEIYANGQWGTICVDQWTDNEAKVACHMMGFNRSLARSTSFYPSELEMAMNSFDQVHCSGNEDHIVYCNVTANNWDVHDCSKLGVAGVKCENDYISGVLDPTLDNFILFNDVFEGQLVRMDTETFSYTTAALQFSNFTPIAIAFDPLAQKVYFSEVKGNTSLIRQTDLRGQILNTLGSTPDGSVINGMVVDTRQDIIFYTDAGNRRIVSIKPDGSNYLVVSSDVDQPKGLAIDKNSGYYIDNRLYVTAMVLAGQRQRLAG
ncbi:hypothetical protein Btru_050136 [Bulinus truncatus]|nr:hypothetical protein Btru_050136 [Bulinus truncatus]